MATKNNENKTVLNVLRSGLDFILTAIEHLRNDTDTRNLVYTVLFLHAGVELILKARLENEHWSLVFQDLKKTDWSSYLSSDFISVSGEECLNRLHNICRIQFSNSHLAAIRSLRKKRNKLEHRGVADHPDALIASSIDVLEFVLWFIPEQLPFFSKDKEILGLLKKIHLNLRGFLKIVSQRSKEIEKDLDYSKEIIIQCPVCGQNTMVIDDGTKCMYCGYSADGEDAAHEYIYSIFGLSWRQVADGEILPIYRCPDCWSDSLVNTTYRLGMVHEKFVCFNCGNSWMDNEISFCDDCGAPFIGHDGSSYCDDCFEIKMGKD